MKECKKFSLDLDVRLLALLVFTLNYPPSPSATKWIGWMMMHNCTCRVHTCKHRRFKNVWWTGHVIHDCPEAVVECCFLFGLCIYTDKWIIQSKLMWNILGITHCDFLHTLNYTLCFIQSFWVCFVWIFWKL